MAYTDCLPLKFTAFDDIYILIAFQKQTKEIKEKQTSVMAELAKVEPAVQDAKMGKPPVHPCTPIYTFYISYIHPYIRYIDPYTSYTHLIYTHIYLIYA